MTSNMKKWSLYLLTLLTGLASVQAQKNVKLTEKWRVSEGLKTPESVFYDAENDLFYVSNINGQPLEKDHNGYISKVSADGKMIKSDWVQGLHAPKGMHLDEHTLYVTDIDRFVIIDTQQEVVSKIIDVEGAKFLNDVTVSPQGDVYITDSEVQAIYKLSEGRVEKWLDLGDYSFPNGLRFYNGNIVVGVVDHILAIDPETQEINVVASGTGGIDGIAKDSKGNYIISDWNGVISYVTPEKGKQELLNVKDKEINTADFEYIPAKNMIYVPTFFDNKVVAYEMSIKK